MVSQRLRSAWVAAVAVAVSLVGGVVVASPADAVEDWSPRFERSIGGTGLAGVYAWGLQYNPVTDEVLVSDYFNYIVRRYNRQGEQIGTFGRPAAERNGQPYSIAVDERNGDIYVSEYGDAQEKGFIAKYDKKGTFLYAAKTNTRYLAWIATDAEGYLYIADSHFWNNAADPAKIKKYSFDDATQTATEVQSFGVYGNEPGQINTVRGMAVASNGHLYLADGGQNRINEFTNDGTFVRSINGPFRGDLRGLSLDEARDQLVVVDAQGAQIERFRLSTGQHLGTSGSEGSGPGQFADGGRQVDVTPDGHIWVADYGNFKIHEYTSAGSFVDEYPKPNPDPATGFVSKLRDVSVAPDGSVWVADTWNHRFQRFAEDGKPLGTWGRRNSFAPYGMNYPRGIGVDPATGNVWVANTRGHQFRVYDKDATFLFDVGTGEDSTDLNSFRWVLDVEFAGDTAIVTDYVGGMIKGLSTADGSEQWKIPLYVVTGTALDVAADRMYAVSPVYNRIVVYQLSTGTMLGMYGAPGDGPGLFSQTMDIDLMDGVLYVSDVDRHKVIAYATDGTFVGEFGGMGSAPGQFREPSGISHDAQGRLYVADSANYRVQVFSMHGGQTSDGVGPTGTIDDPAAGGTLAPGLVSLSGSFTDVDGAGVAEVLIRDTTTGLTWDVGNSAWDNTGGRWAMAGIQGADRQTRTWAYPFPAAEAGHTYEVRLRTYDAAGTLSPQVTRTFTVPAPVTDTQKPGSTIASPTVDQVVSSRPVAVSGSASDDVALAGVEVGVKDRTTSKWWNPATGTWGPLLRTAATLSTPGGKTSSWSFAFDDSVAKGSGQYLLSVRAVDASGKVQDPVTRRFSVAAAPPPSDTAAPTTTIASPTAGQLFGSRPVAFGGSATDDRAVATVEIAVKQNGTTLFWNPATNSWSTGVKWFKATLASPGAASTGWSASWSDAASPGSGSYYMQVRATDTAGKKSVLIGRKFRIG